MRHKILLYRALDELEKKNSRDGKLYNHLFDEYVGNDRKDYLNSLLKKDTYIITLNRAVDNVYSVLTKIYPDFDPSRIHSVRETYDEMVKVKNGIEKTEKALIIKISQILKLLKEDERGLFVDDMFDKELFDKCKNKMMKTSRVSKTLENLDYFFVNKQMMSGIEKKYIEDSGVVVSKYKKLFLDFDDTITKETGSIPLINGKKYTYSYFMNII